MSSAIKSSCAVLFISIYAFGLDGIAIGVHSSSTNSYGHHFGSIRAHLLVNSAVVDVKDVYSQTDARCVNVSPSGNRFAFIRSDGKICIKNMEEGGDVQVLGTVPNNAWIDWPMEGWIYKSNAWAGNELWRVNTVNGTEEKVGSFNDGTNMHQIAVSQDGTRGTTVRSNSWSAVSFNINMSTKTLQKTSDNGGCGPGISPDGRYFTNNQGQHDAVIVRDGNNIIDGIAQPYKTWTTSKCSKAGSNWNRLRWSANSNNWVCFTQGAPYQLENFHNIVLYYIHDAGTTNIQVTNNGYGSYDEADDFWEGDPYSVFGSKPRIGLSASRLTFNATADGGDPDPQEITITNTGTAGTNLPSLSASTDAAWLVVEVINGNQKIRNSIDKSHAVGGVQQATVTVSGADVSDVTYSVTLVYKEAQNFTSVKITPSSAFVAPGATKEFSAQALDQDGDPMASQPSFSWSVDGGGAINQAGMFSAGYTMGGPFTVTAEATIGGTTYSGTASVSVQSLLFRINCGGGQVDNWQADGYYTGGAAFSFTGTVSTDGVDGAAPAAIYGTCRHLSPTYNFGAGLVPDGDYVVHLHFNDANGSVGQRKMNISIEGVLVISNLDIVADAGGQNKALVKEVPVTVNDGNGMTIALAQGSGNDAFICGIEVFAASSDMPVMHILSPKEGDIFGIGDQLTVVWECDTALVSGVKVLFSIDGGVTTHLISDPTGAIASHDPGSNGRTFTWTIPPEIGGEPIASTHCIIRVEDYYDYNTKFDVSGVFTIQEAGAIKTAHASILPAKPGIYKTGGRISVQVPAAAGNVRCGEVHIQRMNGAAVNTFSVFKPGTYLLDTRSLPAGVYVIRLATEGTTISKMVPIMNK